MQSDLFISIAVNFLSGLCTEATFIYIFYRLFGKNRSWSWILTATIIIDLIIIPATLILQLQFIFVGLGQVSVQGVNCLLNIFFFWIIERKESKKKVTVYIILAFFMWSASFHAIGGPINDIYWSIVENFGGHTIYFIGTIISASIAVVIISAVCYFDKRYNLCRIFYRLPEKVNSWPKIMLFFAAMVVLLSLTEIIERANLSVIVGLGFISIIYVVILMMFIYFRHASMLQEQKTQMQTEMLGQQEMYIQELESIQSSMRSFRHDYKNMMSSLYLQSREGNIEEIEKNIHGLIDDFDENIDRKMNLTVQMANIQISEVKSLLYKKITEIQKKGIDFRMEVMYPVEETGMKPLDLSRVLGILLDNAIEAVEQVKGDISLVISAQADGVHIILDNTADQDVDISKIYEDGYSTKGSGRGTGLYSLREITANYENVNLMTECTNLRFIQRIDILNQSDQKIK